MDPFDQKPILPVDVMIILAINILVAGLDLLPSHGVGSARWLTLSARACLTGHDFFIGNQSGFRARARSDLLSRLSFALSPIRDTLFEGFSHFVTSMTAPIAFRPERLPGGVCTHWKAPPLHGARHEQTFAESTLSAFSRAG